MAARDPFDLARFVDAQARVYDQALAELRAGAKRSHWIWFVFPQMRGLGRSSMAEAYGMTSLAEARAYLAHPVLGPRLIECAEATLALEGRPLGAIFPSPDDMKFRSSMTLFARAAGDADNVFVRALRCFCDGREDPHTLDLLDAAGR